MYGAILLCFLCCLLCPLTGYDVIGHLVFHEIHRNHGELCIAAALEKQYLIIIRNSEEFSAFDRCDISMTDIPHP